MTKWVLVSNEKSVTIEAYDVPNILGIEGKFVNDNILPTSGSFLIFMKVTNLQDLTEIDYDHLILHKGNLFGIHDEETVDMAFDQDRLLLGNIYDIVDVENRLLKEDHQNWIRSFCIPKK